MPNFVMCVNTKLKRIILVKNTFLQFPSLSRRLLSSFFLASDKKKTKNIKLSINEMYLHNILCDNSEFCLFFCVSLLLI